MTSLNQDLELSNRLTKLYDHMSSFYDIESSEEESEREASQISFIDSYGEFIQMGDIFEGTDIYICERQVDCRCFIGKKRKPECYCDNEDFYPVEVKVDTYSNCAASVEISFYEKIKFSKKLNKKIFRFGPNNQEITLMIISADYLDLYRQPPKESDQDPNSESDSNGIIRFNLIEKLCSSNNGQTITQRLNYMDYDIL